MRPLFRLMRGTIGGGMGRPIPRAVSSVRSQSLVARIDGHHAGGVDLGGKLVQGRLQAVDRGWRGLGRFEDCAEGVIEAS